MRGMNAGKCLKDLISDTKVHDSMHSAFEEI